MTTWPSPVAKRTVLNSTGPRSAWGSRSTRHHGGVLRIGEHLYGHSDSKGWICQEFKTGKVVWQNRSVGKGSIVYADGHLYLRSEGGQGAIALVEATTEGYKEKSRFDQPNRSRSNSWSHPVVANGRLYIRDQGVLLCYDVKQK
jgi:outer membrane protein assembly factor BamB